MTMNLKESYSALFHVLDAAFWAGCGKKDNGLGPLCGAMDPNGVFEGGPADPVLFEEWKGLIGDIDVSESNILPLTIAFCQKCQWGLDHTIDFLKNDFSEDMLMNAIGRKK